jgi:hypothetical protein
MWKRQSTHGISGSMRLRSTDVATELCCHMENTAITDDTLWRNFCTAVTTGGRRSITGTWEWDLAAARAPIYCPALSQYASLFRPSIITIPRCLCSWNTTLGQKYVTLPEHKAWHKLQTVLAEYLPKIRQFLHLTAMSTENLSNQSH